MGKINRIISAFILLAICMIVILFSFTTLEIGPTSTTPRINKLHCPKKSRCYWTTEINAKEMSIQVKIALSDLLAGIFASCLLVIGEITNIPYCYMPWLFFCFKSLLTLQGPAIFTFGYAALSLNSYTAAALLLLSVFLYAEEWALWFEMLNSFKIVWRERKTLLQEKVFRTEINRNQGSGDINQNEKNTETTETHTTT